MASFTRYQSTLSAYNQRLGTADFSNTAPTVEGEYNSKYTSGLGTDVGQKLNGFQSVTKTENYSGQFKNILLGLALVKLTEEVAGESLTEVFDDAFEGIGSGNANVNNTLTAAAALTLLTGSSPAAGFLKSYYGGSSGLAVGNLLSKATGKDVTSLVSAIQGVHSAGNADQFVAAGLSRSLGAVLAPVISSFNSKVDTEIGTAIAPVLQAVMDISAGPIGILIDELTGNKLKTLQNQNIVSLLSQGKYAEAILLTSNNSSSPYNLIEETLLGIDTKVSTRITYTGSNQVSPFDIGQNDNKWEGAETKTWKDPDAQTYSNIGTAGIGARSGIQTGDTGIKVTSQSEADSVMLNEASTEAEKEAARAYYASGIKTDTTVSTTLIVTSESQAFSILQNPLSKPDERAAAQAYFGAVAPASDSVYKFTRVNGLEELEAEFRSATRDITEVVVHWSAHFLNQDIGAEEIHGQHKTDGFDGIGYHYVIRKDGTIERGRPINKEGAHAKANGHNVYSIGIAFVGGYTINSSRSRARPPSGVESFTEPQMKALRMFFNAFYKVWPGGQAWGHSDTDKNKIDPGFSVPEFVRSKFGKENVSASGTDKPLSPEQIAGGS